MNKHFFAAAFAPALLNVALVAALLIVPQGGQATALAMAWAVLAGVGSGVGTGFLYRGLASGRMGVVAPISAVGAAVVPVLAGTLGGERLSLVVWSGIVLALPGIWLVGWSFGTDLTLMYGLDPAVKTQLMETYKGQTEGAKRATRLEHARPSATLVPSRLRKVRVPRSMSFPLDIQHLLEGSRAPRRVCAPRSLAGVKAAFLQ